MKETEKITNGITELVFIIDRSGSMNGLEEDTIGGFNSMLEKQKGKDGKCYVSTVLFNHISTVVHDRVDIDNVKPMTRDDYVAAGSTALIDALGDSIRHIGNIHKYARREDVPDNTMFVIITDGMENASHRYSSDEVKKMVTKEEEKYGWEFVFIGANIDSVETAKTYGIREERAVNYVHDKTGTANVYCCIGNAIGNIRANAAPDEACFSAVKEDYKKRDNRFRRK